MSCVKVKVSDAAEQLLHQMKEAGLRITDQRRALLDFLVSTDKAVTVPQIYHELLEQGVQVDEASIYRSVKVLKDIKIVHELNQGQISLCQHSSCGANHLHLSWLCDVCGDTQEPPVKKKELEDLQKILGFKRNQISHVRINYMCDKCRA